MNRRDFLKDSAKIAAVAAVSSTTNAFAGNTAPAQKKEVAPSAVEGIPGEEIAAAEAPQEPQTPPASGKLIISAPMLQNYAETSMGVAFAVSDMANGFVSYSESPDMRNAVTVKCGGFRVTDMNDKVMLVRLTGLKPATKYYYTIGADRISYKGGYAMKILGTDKDERVYSFRTAGKKADPHFCVINDTHAKWETFDLLTKKLAVLAPSCVIWNGDASNVEESIDSQVEIFLNPPVTTKDFASEIPYLFSPGNHDSRGMANRHIERVWMFRQNEERSPRDWDLGRNFAVRMGSVAMIGLDTAEDKLDTNPLFAGLFSSKAYREAQTLWLKDALKRPEIASAPYLVAFCHIPLFDPDPTANPGDVAPADKDPRYTTDYAHWQRTCANMWGPLLKKAGCQLVITADQPKYRYDAPDKERGWAQIVGAGPPMREKSYPTIVEGKVENGKLDITVHNIFTGQVQETFSFAPRRRRRSE